jgi:hypothetical protein
MPDPTGPGERLDIPDQPASSLHPHPRKQELRRYYGPVRRPAPRRYSAPSGVCLGTLRLRPWRPATPVAVSTLAFSPYLHRSRSQVAVLDDDGRELVSRGWSTIRGRSWGLRRYSHLVACTVFICAAATGVLDQRGGRVRYVVQRRTCTGRRCARAHGSPHAQRGRPPRHSPDPALPRLQRPPRLLRNS